MSSSDEQHDNAEWVTASKFYRRRPGLGWLAGLLIVPLLLGAIGHGGLNGSRNDGDTALPTVGPSATLSTPPAKLPAGPPAFAPLSIIRTGNGFTVSGDVPDATAKTSLLNMLRASFPGANVADESNIKAGVNAPNFSGLGPVFDAAVDIPDFELGINDGTLTLTGNAPSEDSRAAVESAAKEAWPNQLTNNIRVEPAPAPHAPAPAGTPAPTADGACADLAADIGSLLKTPITFATDGFTLTPDSGQRLAQVASKLAGCPDAEVDVRGHTDNTGNDAINVPLSANRAKSVADFLVAHGVAGDRVSSQGLGSGDPVASNNAPDGRAQNRRVEITVK